MVTAKMNHEVETKRHEEELQAETTLRPVAKPEETPELMGLCVTCEDRDCCAHAKKTGGVWHCEMFV